MTPNISVLIVDDHEVVRDGLSAIINRQSDMTVIGEASNGEEAIEAYRRLRPEVVLMDLKMPVLSGWLATSRIRAEFPAARILVLTTLGGDQDVYRALQAGAMGYLLKDTPSAAILTAIRGAMVGLRTLSATADAALSERQDYAELTQRELHVLHAIADGKSNKQIAFELNVGESTIKGHVSNIMSKLGATDRTGAVTLGLRRGLITLTPKPRL